MSEDQTSIEQAGGCAVGLTGTISAWNADSEANLCKALKWVGEYVEHEADVLLGHIKAAVVNDAGEGITLNLTNMESGIEHHGTLGPQEKVKFSFMAAVLDVDEHELDHMMFHAIDDCGIDYELDEAPKCSCGCHDHDHHHEHEHHHHEHGEECHCHEHEHEHHHHEHYHADGSKCDCDHEHDHNHAHYHADGSVCHCHEHDEEEHCECCDDKEVPGVHYYHHYIHEYHYYYHFDDLDEVHKAYLRKHAHHHEHGEECHCHEHEHEHHHAHYHADGSECHCHDPDECDQKHYHADGSECHCHDKGNEEHCSCCESKQ